MQPWIAAKSTTHKTPPTGFHYISTAIIGPDLKALHTHDTLIQVFSLSSPD